MIRRKWFIVWAIGLVLAARLLGLRTSAAGDDAPAYTPVAPAPAIQAALESNLRQVSSWLEQEDFTSAAQSARGLTALAWLHGLQGTGPRWRERTAALRTVCARLEAAARRKDRAGCEQAVRDCAGLLASLAREGQTGGRKSVQHFAPSGSTKTWMLLMEGAYTDAKAARTARELERYAYELAEEANVVSYLRPDPRWRKMAGETRAAALRAAEMARKGDVEATRKALRAVYVRCEGCHQGYKR